MFDIKDPAVDAVPVTPSDTVDLTLDILNVTKKMCRSLLIGTSGNIKVLTVNNQERTFKVPVGIIPLQVRRVFATGTTASDITALF